MEEFLLFNELYDCYSMLLTENEKLVFNDYYLEDLSMQEIADNNQVSKSAIHKTIKIVKEKLLDYENKLKLNKINKKLRDLINSDDLNKIKKELKQLLK